MNILVNLIPGTTRVFVDNLRLSIIYICGTKYSEL